MEQNNLNLFMCTEYFDISKKLRQKDCIKTRKESA